MKRYRLESLLLCLLREYVAFVAIYHLVLRHCERLQIVWQTSVIARFLNQKIASQGHSVEYYHTS
ncbi:hypothetical protein [uncultured Helicobacter sp.]|uniref:hypothetical protein n=1 Tax=uncultured Helicobacter sp. TaxID=175537 RepID=UPI0026101289|nr:hypothetical protein [uncultured Helicobacter sp.]